MLSISPHTHDAVLPTLLSANALRLMPFERDVATSSSVKCISHIQLAGPGDSCLIHRCNLHHHHATVKSPEAALFGLIPSWACDARSATQNCVVHVTAIANKPAYRSALQQAQFCWLSVSYFLGTVWKNGREHTVRIQHIDDSPLHLAGIWSEWILDNGTPVLSFCLLTRNMDMQLQTLGIRLGQGMPQCYAAFDPGDLVGWLRLPVEQVLHILGEIKLPPLRITPHQTTDRSRHVT